MASILNFLASNIAIAAVNGVNNIGRGAKHAAHGAKVAAQGAKDAAASFKAGADYAHTINKVSGQRADYLAKDNFDPKVTKTRRVGTKR